MLLQVNAGSPPRSPCVSWYQIVKRSDGHALVLVVGHRISVSFRELVDSLLALTFRFSL